MLHIIGFFALLIPLVFLGPRGNTNEIFTTFLNGGVWPTQGLSFFIGLAGNAVAFQGVDSAIHVCKSLPLNLGGKIANDFQMSEEIKNARINVPRAMIASIVINGMLGFGMLLAIIYCAGDLTAAFESPTGYPFIEIFTQATSSVGGATAMASVVTIIAFCATIGTVAAASRQLWAFARDRGVPGWRILSKVSSSAPYFLFESIAF